MLNYKIGAVVVGHIQKLIAILFIIWQVITINFQICQTDKNMDVNDVKVRRLIRRYVECYQQKNEKKKEKMKFVLDKQLSKLVRR